jgi:mRNA interferase YafQ
MVERALDRLRENMLDSRLKTHHLGGKLFGIYACSCGYDCRIVFKLSVDEKKKTERILLLDIGSHDEVY